MSQTTAQQKSAGAQQCGTNQNSSVTGDLRLHEFRSRVFHNVRLLRVWLPPCYDDPGNERGYPVLYLNDGQNLFDRTTAHTGIEWQADETADRLIREQKIPPMIIVGIDNAQKDRLKEYLPYRSFSPPVLRPQGKKYPDFLLREVMPFVQKNYRTAKLPEQTGLGGSSLGASIFLAACFWRALHCPFRTVNCLKIAGVFETGLTVFFSRLEPRKLGVRTKIKKSWTMSANSVKSCATQDLVTGDCS